MKFKIKILTFAFCILNLNCYAQSQQYVRVAIVRDAESLSLKARGFYEITDSRTNEVVYRGKNLKTTVAVSNREILLTGQRFSQDKISIRAKDPDIIIINNRPFRGRVCFVKNQQGRLLAVNYINLEDYIKGILYHEVSHYWPAEALKAQAIVSRTYALYQMQENKSRDYDVTADIYSQVYGGRMSERFRTNKAVKATEGKILTYQGKIFPAYFHATCAGHTEDASLLWKIDLAPLKGVSCSFCKDAPHFRWHYVLTLSQVRESLAKAGFHLGEIRNISILGRDRSGRITHLKITDRKRSLKVSSKDFRNSIGPNIIRSTNFSVNIVKEEAIFNGFGWGHGVGFCQWGAYFLSKQGYSAEQILKYYYPGAEISLIVNR